MSSVRECAALLEEIAYDLGDEAMHRYRSEWLIMWLASWLAACACRAATIVARRDDDKPTRLEVMK